MRHIPLVIAGVLAAGCGDSKDWEQEVILQLFRPERADVGAVHLKVTEGARTVEQDVAVTFDSCDKNRVRIIPRKEGSTYLPLDITVSFGVGPRKDVKATAAVPSTDVVKVVLDTGVLNPTLEPKACAPPVTPPVKLPVGSPCTADAECEGLNATCLKSVADMSRTQLFPGGYCTFKCAKAGDSCDNGRGFCKLYNDAGIPPKEYGPYCLRRCTGCAPAACLACDRPVADYACSTADLCYPTK